MAKAKFDIKSLEIPAAVARPLYAGVGATDLAVEYVRETVADVQKRFAGVQKDVRAALPTSRRTSRASSSSQGRQQATTVVNARVDAVTKDAKARRAAVEARIADLQADAKAQAAKVQTVVNDNVSTVTDTYAELAKRGETTLKRLRGEVAGTWTTSPTPSTPRRPRPPRSRLPARAPPRSGREEDRREEDRRQSDVCLRQHPRTRAPGGMSSGGFVCPGYAVPWFSSCRPA